MTLLLLSSCEIDDTNLTGKYYSESKDSYVELKSDGTFIWYDKDDGEIILKGTYKTNYTGIWGSGPKSWDFTTKLSSNSSGYRGIWDNTMRIFYHVKNQRTGEVNYSRINGSISGGSVNFYKYNFYPNNLIPDDVQF